MFDWIIAFQSLLILFLMALLTWIVSLVKRDVSIVDSIWSLFFLAAMLVYYAHPSATWPSINPCTGIDRHVVVSALCLFDLAELGTARR